VNVSIVDYFLFINAMQFSTVYCIKAVVDAEGCARCWTFVVDYLSQTESKFHLKLKVIINIIKGPPCKQIFKLQSFSLLTWNDLRNQ
jgi:hypothetical protein